MYPPFILPPFPGQPKEGKEKQKKPKRDIGNDKVRKSPGPDRSCSGGKPHGQWWHVHNRIPCAGKWLAKSHSTLPEEAANQPHYLATHTPLSPSLRETQTHLEKNRPTSHCNQGQTRQSCVWRQCWEGTNPNTQNTDNTEGTEPQVSWTVLSLLSLCVSLGYDISVGLLTSLLWETWLLHLLSMI